MHVCCIQIHFVLRACSGGLYSLRGTPTSRLTSPARGSGFPITQSPRQSLVLGVSNQQPSSRLHPRGRATSETEMPVTATRCEQFGQEASILLLEKQLGRGGLRRARRYEGSNCIKRPKASAVQARRSGLASTPPIRLRP